MKRIKMTLTAAAVVCAAGPSLAQALLGSEWQPVEVDGRAIETPGEAFVRFEQDNRFFGNAGCNTMRGGVVTNQDAILFGPAAMTMMACPDSASLSEYDFTRALTRARFFAREGTELELKDGGGVIIMRLRQRDAD